MGSDGFESKKAGVPSIGAGPDRFAPSEPIANVERNLAVDSFAAADGAAVNLVEISGVIKWFDASKGYGFIVPDNGWPDVLLHVTVLRRDGYQTAYEGARLIVECVQRQKGYQAFRIVSMDESTAIHPAQMLPARTHVSVTPTSGLERAQVKWFQPASRLRLPHLRRRHAGHFRAHGNPAPLRHDRAAPRPVRTGPVRTGFQGHDGRRNPARNRRTRTVVALIRP